MWTKVILNNLGLRPKMGVSQTTSMKVGVRQANRAEQPADAAYVSLYVKA